MSRINTKKTVVLRMSAPPMAAVVVYPFKKLNTVLAPRKEAAIIGVGLAIVKKPAIVPALALNKPRFKRCFPGRARGLLDILAASFRKATIEPVNVTPPITTPKYAVTRCRVERCDTSASTLPMLVRTAERPTMECSRATVCGSSVAVTRRPITVPIMAPMEATPANCAITSGANPTAPRDASTPELTPRIPRALP